MACNNDKCGKPKDCEKSVCCGICQERTDCPHGNPCPTCTGKPTNDEESESDSE